MIFQKFTCCIPDRNIKEITCAVYLIEARESNLTIKTVITVVYHTIQFHHKISGAHDVRAVRKE